MKRFFIILLSLSITLSAFVSTAEAQTSRIFPGNRDGETYRGWPANKLVILDEYLGNNVWVNAYGGKPVVKAPGIHVTLRFENVAHEHNSASGWRIKLIPEAGMVGKTIRVTVKVRGRTFNLIAKVLANPLVVATRARTIAKRAEETANDAHKNSGGTGGKRDVELTLGPLFSLESPGNEGYGLALGVNAILGKFASKGMVQLGISGRLSWHYYEQEVIGLAQNSDVMASEFDALAMFLFRLRPVSWFAAEGSTGFGMRVFTHDDSVTIQDQNLLIRGVEGRVAAHPLWALNLGVKFWPSKVVSLGVQWGTTVSLTRQVQNPNAEGGDPSKGHLWNHFIFVTLGININ